MSIILNLAYTTPPVYASMFFLTHNDEDLEGYGITRWKEFRPH